jgi:osmotically-inducible protein OsmY
MLTGFLAGPIAACSETTGEYIDDVTISTKVRAQLVDDKDLNVTQIDVETLKGVVSISGFVDSEAKKAKASTVARSVSGVKEVRNNLIVKK